MKKIPDDAEGQVSTAELAKILGASYQSVYLWTKSGRISALPSESRIKSYDLAQVREQLAGNAKPAAKAVAAPVTEDAPKPKRKYTRRAKAEPAPEVDEAEVESPPEVKPGLLEQILQEAAKEARRAYKRCLRAAVKAALGADESTLATDLMKNYFGARQSLLLALNDRKET